MSQGKNIPVIKALEQKHPGATEAVADEWEKFCRRHYKYASELLGGVRLEEAKAFASIVHCIHLLGDREEGNSDRGRALVLPVSELVEEISSQAKLLFGSQQWDDKDVRRLKDATKSGSEEQKAKAVLMVMTELKFGTKLHDKYGARIRSKWTASGSP